MVYQVFMSYLKGTDTTQNQPAATMREFRTRVSRSGFSREVIELDFFPHYIMWISKHHTGQKIVIFGSNVAHGLPGCNLSCSALPIAFELYSSPLPLPTTLLSASVEPVTGFLLTSLSTRTETSKDGGYKSHLCVCVCSVMSNSLQAYEL